MNKLKTFFYVLKNSITSPKYYNDILKTDLWFSLKYFLMLSFFASLIFTAVSSISVIPEIMSGTRFLAENIKEIYPEDLVITFKDSEWETNKNQPVIIPMPNFDEEAEQYLPDNLIVLDKNGTIDMLEEFNTLVLINDENLIYRGENEVVTAQPLDSIPDVTLDRSTVNFGIDRIYSLVKFLPYILPLLILIFTFLFNYLGGVFFNVLLVGVVIFFISLAAKFKVPFSSALKISIHSVTIPVILQLALIPFPQISAYLPGWFAIATLVISAYFMFKMRGEADLKKIEK